MRKATIDSELVQRITEMEHRYDSLTRALGNLEAAIAEYQALAPELQILRDYMDSGQWQKDFEADEAGRIPAEIKRGVLSEDGLYDLLESADSLTLFSGDSRNIPKA